MGAITYTVEADFDQDEVYETNLTPRAGGPGGGLSIDRGMDLSGRYKTSTLSIVLDNEDGELTTDNISASLSGLIVPRVPIRVKANFNSVDYTLWTGYIDRIDSEWSADSIYTVRFDCMDLSGFLPSYAPVHVSVSNSRDVDDALAAIMDDIGFDADDRLFDDAVANLAYHFVVGADAMSAMLDAVKSEMGGLLWVTADGKLRFEARNSRLGSTPDRTWGDGTEIIPRHVTYRMNQQDIVTKVNVVETLFAQGDQTVVILRWSRGEDSRPPDSIQLQGNETYGPVVINYDGLATSIVSPVANTDYTANNNIDGSGSDRTSNLSVTVNDNGGSATFELRNTSSTPLYVTKMRIRGIPIALTGSRPQYEVAKSVPGVPGNTGIQIDVPYGGDTAGQKGRDYAIQILHTYRYAYPLIELLFEWAGDTLTTEMLSVDIGDLILFNTKALSTDGPQVKDLFYVERIAHSGIQGGSNPSTSILLSPAYNYRDLDKITYDRFTRSNTGSGLGTSLSGDAWQDSTDFKILTNRARATSDTKSIAYIDLMSSDCVVEATMNGI